MATAIEMLKSVAAQMQLSSPLGRWMQKVSVLLDAGVAAPQYAYVKRAGTAQTPINANKDLELDIAGGVRGIGLAGVGGATLFTLTPGKTYTLRALGWFENFQNDTDYLQIQWVDGNNSGLTTGQAACPSVRFIPATSTSKASSAAGVEFIFSVPVNATVQQQTVKLRCVAASGQADLPAGSWCATIEEIPG